jgi:hypothetical protein
MDNIDEAAAIFIRMFEALARRSGKTLNERSRADITRACRLLASAGGELDDLLDDAPAPAARPERAREYSTVSFEPVPPEVTAWREKQRDRG